MLAKSVYLGLTVLGKLIVPEPSLFQVENAVGEVQKVQVNCRILLKFRNVASI
jgi:hypothetical protein